MVYCYTGTPGSGKSYNVARFIYDRLRNRRAIICNFPVNTAFIRTTRIGRLAAWLNKRFGWHLPEPKCRIGRCTYVKSADMTPEYLIDYARKNHEKGKPRETVVIIDEASLMFSPRIKGDQRNKWIEFMATHRHMGFDVFLIVQHIKMIDQFIGFQVEYNVVHRDAKNYKMLGKLLSFLSGGHLFLAITKWHGINEVVEREFFMMRKKTMNVYDTYHDFTGAMTEERKPPQKVATWAKPQGGGDKDETKAETRIDPVMLSDGDTLSDAVRSPVQAGDAPNQ